MNPVDAANQIAAKAKAASASFRKALALVLRELERNLPPILTGIQDDTLNTLNALQARATIRQELTKAGYDHLATNALAEPLVSITDAVLQGRGDGLDPRLAALRALHLWDLLDEGDQVSRALWQATMRGVFGVKPIPAILADLADILEERDATIRTLYDTSVSIYGRQVEAVTAGDDPETPFAYLGPADQKTRPFCRAHLGRVYTRAEIDALDNGQIDNVFLTGGGYNCRHVWMEVSKLSELYDLLGTEQRVPEIQAQLDQQDAA